MVGPEANAGAWSALAGAAPIASAAQAPSAVAR
jgi:hypothetical protein